MPLGLPQARPWLGEQACEWLGHWLWIRHRKENRSRCLTVIALKAERQGVTDRSNDQHPQSQPSPVVPVLFMDLNTHTEWATDTVSHNNRGSCAQGLAIFTVLHFITIATVYRWNNISSTSLFRGTHSDRVKWNMSTLWPDKRISFIAY